MQRYAAYWCETWLSSAVTERAEMAMPTDGPPWRTVLRRSTLRADGTYERSISMVIAPEPYLPKAEVAWVGSK